MRRLFDIARPGLSTILLIEEGCATARFFRLVCDELRSEIQFKSDRMLSAQINRLVVGRLRSACARLRDASVQQGESHDCNCTDADRLKKQMMTL